MDFISVFIVLAKLISLTTAINWNGNNWAHGCTFNGADLTKANVPAKYCSSKCAQTLRCTHFVWTSNEGGTCHMKQGVVSKWDAIQINDQTTVCGVLLNKQNNGNCVAWLGNNWAQQCDFNSPNIQTLSTPASHCGGKCVETHGCTHFSWSGGTCRLKSGQVRKIDAFLVDDESSVCGVVGSSFDNQFGCVYWNGNIWAHACDFKGNDIGKLTNVPGKLCWQLCGQKSECTHFKWTPDDSGTCHLKKGSVSDSDVIATADQSSVCGLIPPGSENGIFWNGNNWAMSCDFNGRDIKTVLVAGDQCASVCSATEGCTHFSWKKTTQREGTCHLKHGTVLKSDAVPTGDDEATACGLLSSPDEETALELTSQSSVANTGSTLELAVCYDAMHNAEYPLNGQQKPSEGLAKAIDDDFKQISKYFRYVRTFFSTFYDVPVAPAAAKYGVKLYLGVYMTDEDWYQNQVDAAVQSVKNHPNTIEAVLVGNENLRPNGPYSADQIISRIKNLKEAIRAATGRDVPVGTVQRNVEWLSKSLRAETQKLAANSDIIGVNIYPFFGRQSSNANNINAHVESDMRMLNIHWKSMIDLYGASKVRLTETGFPTGGGVSPSGVAANLERSVAYFETIEDWRPAQGQGPLFWFSFYDRRADDHSVPGAFEKNFGLFTAERNSKSQCL